jgi:hypothetical protein
MEKLRKKLAHAKLPLYVLVQSAFYSGSFYTESHRNGCIRQEWRSNSQGYKGRQELLVKGYV